MTGFFKSISKHEVSAPLKGISKSKGCYECKLYKKCKSPMMKYYGNGNKNILLVGEAPGYTEDEEGIPFVGESGQLLDDVLYSAGIDMDEDCIRTNAVNCRPTKEDKNRTPSNTEIECCRHRLKQTIHILKPEKIILLGLSAITSFIGDRMDDIGKMERWVGWKIPDQKYKTWVYPTYHPSYIIRNNKDRILKNIFTKTIADACYHDEQFTIDNIKVEILINEKDIINFLKKIIAYNPEYYSFDIECSGLKPHREGHFIKTVSISFCRDMAVSFPFLSKNITFLKLFKKLMTNKSKKIIQNYPMEASWIETKLGYEITNFAMDTMIAEHILDNRRYITGLKFQTYIHYGVSDYSRNISEYLESKKKGGNEFNRINEAPIKLLLNYNGKDSGYTFKRFEDQTIALDEEDLNEAYDFFHDGIVACYHASRNGIHINIKYFEKIKKKLEKELEKLKEDIYSSEEHKLWKNKKGIDIDIASPHQIKELVTKILKLKVGKKTKKGNDSVDKTVLERLKKKRKVFDDILQWRKKEKMLSTYILGILRESIDGIIHSNLNLHLPRTYRGSVDKFNFQNIPNRDEEAKKLVRTGIIPSKGNKLMSIDYSGVEVRSGCIYHGDKQMIDYVVHGKGDMHKEYAAKLFLLPEEEVSKPIRYEGKNGFIFPQFYGDYYVHNVDQLWPASKRLFTVSGKNVREHLKEMGLNNRKKFEEHVKQIEREFWEETFPEFNEWKKEAWEDYVDSGYVYTLTGFRFGGYMNRKHVVNYPFQGTAFHWLLWSMIEGDDHIEKNNLKSKIVMQVHDELLIDLYPPEEKYIHKLFLKIMTKDIKKYWKWINIPLEVEVKTSEIDGNWYDMKVI